MSLFGALGTAISGLNSQSAAFGNISDNIANSQTTGFKRADTSFVDFLTNSTATDNEPGAVVALPQYVNTVQGSISQTDNPLALAISGQGFFAVSQQTGETTGGAPVLSTGNQFTRNGSFQLNNSGFLVNSSGDFLNGWLAGANGQINTNALAPIQISQAALPPTASTTVTLGANLPPAGNPDPTTGVQGPILTNASVFDAKGTAHQLSLSFTSAGANSNDWTLTVKDDQGATIGTGTLAFGAGGTLASITQGGTTTSTAGAVASLALATNFPTAGGGNQAITLNLGTIGGSTGITQFAGSTFTPRSLTTDGTAPGNFSSITVQNTGDIVVNYDNGQSRTVAQVPVTTFAAPDGLQRQDGSNFTATLASGVGQTKAAGNGGAGTLATNSLEQSNVDIASQFSQLIVAQQAYSANAKTITTADTMLQTTLDMLR